LAHDGFAGIGNGAITNETDGEHDDSHGMKNGTGTRIGMHEHGQTGYHGQDDDIWYVEKKKKKKME
jgi:hypothetical protein